MTDNFVNHIVKTSVASLCQAIGWNSTHSSAIDVLADIWKRQFLHMAKLSTKYAIHYGRTEVSLDDTAQAFRDLNFSVGDLEEYVQYFDAVSLPYDVPNFPIERESCLNFLRPGSDEVLTRPAHVHEYMPPWDTSATASSSSATTGELTSVVGDKSNAEPTPGSSTSDNENDSTLAVKDTNVPQESNAFSIKAKNAPSIADSNMDKVSADVDTTGRVKIDEIHANGIKEEPSNRSQNNAQSPDSTPPQASTTNTSMSKSNKRLDSSTESPALKRVRMLLEEEGATPREIKSVMMTTSGFITSALEGRLPESKPPPNRDFFEPVPIEKKKKIPTMKRIVEGVKKLDKEKESHGVKADDEDDQEYQDNLFSNPDKIQKTFKKDKDHDENAVVKDKERRDKSKSLRRSNKKFKSLEKLTREKQKLHKRSESSKAHLEKRRKLKRSREKLEILEDENDDGLEVISSNENFSDSDHQDKKTEITEIKPAKSSAKAILRNKASKNVRAKMLLENVRKDRKKYITKLAKPSSEFNEEDEAANVDESPSVDEPTAKKKRGRPKKAPGLEFSNMPTALFSSPMMIPDKNKSMKITKMTRRSSKQSLTQMEQDEMDMLTPEISINVSKHQRPPPPPPEFSMILGRLPMQPGLIPTSFAPPPSSMRQQQFLIPPSISITPSTPEVSLTPLTSQDLAAAAISSSSSPLGLPSNVCSSITITRINMSDSQQKQAQAISTPSTSGFNKAAMSISITKETRDNKAIISPSLPLQHDNNSGITITPIVMTKHGGSPELTYNQGVVTPRKIEQSGSSMLARLDDDIRTKEERKKDREKRKELKKEKKKEKKLREKGKEKHDKIKISSSIKPERSSGADAGSSDRKEKVKKKKSKDNVSSSTAGRSEPSIPKLTLKIHSSNASTPVDSPIPTGGIMDRNDTPPPAPRKITIKPIEESFRKRTPSPELTRFSPLVTRPAKSSKVSVPLKSSTSSSKTPQSNEVVCFPPIGSSGGSGSIKKARKAARGPGRPAKPSQSGLVIETIGFYVDDQGSKVWICPACGRQDDGSPMIGCDTCDDWYHFTCVGITDTPDETESWFCDRCVVKNTSEHKKKPKP